MTIGVGTSGAGEGDRGVTAVGPAAWDERYRAADRLWSDEPNLFVRDRLGPLEPGTGLDLAAGEGQNAIWLSERGWSMTAVDFSDVASARGRERSDDVEFVVADVVGWAPGRDFSLVLIAYLHLPPEQFRGVVERARGWLAPGGELFLIGHDRSSFEKGCGGPQSPELLWDVDEIRGWLDGMTLVEAQVVRRPKETEDGEAYAPDALVRVRRG